MTIRCFLPVVILAMLGWPAGAIAQAPGGLDVSFLYYVNQDGTGGLDTSITGGPVGQVPSVSWEACPPAAACTPIAPRTGFSPTVLTGTAAPGTVYIATVSYGSQTVKATSLPYLGQVRNLTVPAIQGNLRVGGLVTPQAGAWSGGWGNEWSLLQVQVCQTPGGAGCVVVADGVYWRKCPGTGAVLTYNHVGRYVRVVDERIGRHTPFAAFAVGSPEGLRPIEPGTKSAAAVAGPIQAASGPPEATCGLPPPRVTFAKRAVRRGKRLEIGQIGCLMRCRVRVGLGTCVLTGPVGPCPGLRHGQKRISLAFKRTFPGGPQSGRLLVPYRQTPRVTPGVYEVSVAYGDELGFGPSGQVRVPRRAVGTKSRR